MREYSVEWVQGRDYAGVTAPAGSRLKNQVLKCSEENPDVTIQTQNEDGSIFAHVPLSYVHVRFAPPREISDEQREKARNRMNEMWRMKKENEKKEEKA